MVKILGAPSDGQNKAVYGNLGGVSLDQHKDRFNHLWHYLEGQGLNVPEFLLPQIHMATVVQPFAFERRFVAENRSPPSLSEIRKYDPWVYDIYFGAVGTKGDKHPHDWTYHRYRGDLLAGIASEIAGSSRDCLSVMDVGCHCGVMAMEFAERGFQSVRGYDLRPDNIAQANFLSRTFSIQNILFRTLNARAIASEVPADVVLCAGLFYHVTFPMELLRSLYAVTKEFLIFDSVVQNHAFSGFHLTCQRNVDYSADGEFSYEFNPTYRGTCEALEAAGFKHIYEVLGSDPNSVNLYKARNTRTFVAAKSDNGLFADFLRNV